MAAQFNFFLLDWFALGLVQSHQEWVDSSSAHWSRPFIWIPRRGQLDPFTSLNYAACQSVMRCERRQMKRNVDQFGVIDLLQPTAISLRSGHQQKQRLPIWP